jgi:hypothetical protein
MRAGLGYLAALFICYRIYRAESHRLARREAVLLVFLVLLFTAINCQLHSVMVDRGPNYFEHFSNLAWQKEVHSDVMRLASDSVPHAYRFLPNVVVRWIELGGLDYERARDLYRLITGLLLFYAIYRFARLFTTHWGGILSMSLVAVVFPVSFENYAGQLTDPLSHLSFVLAFIFLETEEFGYLLTTILIGSLAKEAVLALAGYYVLFGWKGKGYRFKAVILCGASAAFYIGVRLVVLRGPLLYSQVSHAPPQLVLRNLTDPRWPLLFFLTAAAFWPFLALSWKETPATLRRLTIYLLPVLWISSTFFGFLTETRNFMPVVFVLAVIAARHLTPHAQAAG